jgi:hypothetical protein
VREFRRELREGTMSPNSLRILVVATKAPWPPVDGGRLLLWRTICGLAAAGVRVTLLAPVDPLHFSVVAAREALAEVCEPVLVAVRPAGLARTVWRAVAANAPLSVARHSVPALRRRVEEALAAGRFDLVHAEQLQALPQVLDSARRLRLPVVLRAQNVESALWGAAAAAGGGALSWEARRLERREGRAVAGVAATVALSAIDAAALRRLAAAAGAPQARVAEVPAPFAAELPAGPPLAGEPAVTLLGSRGWRPNEDALSWFSGEIWPAVRREVPGARLHVFGIDGAPAVLTGDGPPILWHGAPAESAAAFAVGSIHVVPLRIGSGVRMKVLEAWARGVPVVSTPEGAAGLEAADGSELLLARDGPSFAAALRRLHEEPGLASALARGGRNALRTRHDPQESARRLIAVYEEVLAVQT